MTNEISSISGLTDPAEIRAEAERVIQKLLDSFSYSVDAPETFEEIIALAKADWEADAEYRAHRGWDHGSPVR